jgi:large repetitive protein
MRPELRHTICLIYAAIRPTSGYPNRCSVSRIRRLLASVLTLGIAATLSNCGDGVVLPEEGLVSNIAVFDGDGQSGAAGAPLGQPLIVMVTDRRGLPVPSQEVAFTVSTGDGEVQPAAVETDTAGKASTVWTLGPGAGSQQVVAHVGTSTSLVTTFTATAVAGEGSTLELDSGDGQTGSVGSALPDSLVVKVTDGFGNPVSGVAVQWSVLSGGGSISPETSTSGDDGRAGAERVLGPGAGTQSAQASASGFGGSPVTFTHTAIPAVPAALVLVSGNGQTAPAGFTVAESLVVHLEDANGNGIGGKAISWVPSPGSGSASPGSSTTDPNGFAATQWTLGDAVGNNTLNAVFSGLPPVGFTARGTADVPTTLAKNAGDNQSAFVGTTLANPLSVKVTDSHSNPVAGVTVTWTANGGGSVSSPTSATNSSGIAEVNRTLGLTPGDYTTTAEVGGLSGSPVTFTSHATVGTASKLAFTTGPSDRVVGQPFSPPLQVQIQDAGGNLIPTVSSVTITSSQGGTLSGTATVNAVAGIATFSNLAINTVGTGYTLTAHSGSLANAVSDPFDVTQAATTIAITSRNPSPSSVVGQAVTVNYDINIVTPGAGSLSGSVTVSDGAGGTCTGGINAGSGVGSCQLTFTAAGSPSLTATYSGNANFQGSTSSAVSHTVNRANTTINITQDDPDPSVAGGGVTVHWQVTVSSPGAGTPTGTVTITLNGGETATCNAPVGNGQCDLPALTVTGNRTITASYSGDGNFNGDTDTEAHTVNNANGAPTANADGYSVDEDQALNVNSGSGVLANDTDPNGDPLNAAVETNPSHAKSFSFNEGNGSFDYRPEDDFNGTDSFTYHATDGSANSNTVTVTITVNPINDDPSFTKGPDQEVSSFAGSQTVDNWATNISPGPNEAGQTVSFNVSTNHDEAFAVLPAIGSSGTLTFTPNLRFDTVDVTVTVQAQDNLGATSQSQDFKIKINP